MDKSTHELGQAALVPRHIEYLAARGVNAETAARANLRSVSAAEARALTGASNEPPCGGLAIPYPDTTPPYVRVRLDKGLQRFLAPAGRKVPVYVPPHTPTRDKSPLVVVEGPIKALALSASGLPSAGLGGTGTTLVPCASGRKLHESWDQLRVSGRRVIVCFDSNRRLNLCVARDEARLVLALENAGAEAAIADLPHATDGSPWGPDDFLARHGAEKLSEVLRAAVSGSPILRLEELSKLEPEVAHSRVFALLEDAPFLLSICERGRGVEKLATDYFAKHKAVRYLRSALAETRAELKRVQAQGTIESTKYEVRDGRLCRIANYKEREYVIPLCNFAPTIEREVVIDDGVQTRRVFEITARLASGPVLPVIAVSPAELTNGHWPLQLWGSKAVVEAQRGVLDHLRAALQTLSKPDVQQIYAHTGWRDTTAGPIYLHGGGAVGGSCQVHLDGHLSRYVLPTETTNLKNACQVALELIDIGPHRITVPLLLAAFRAPLAHVLPIDCLVHCYGSTGCFKSTVAALFLNFFGSFTHDSLPASFHDTSAALEWKLNTAKDTLIVVDEFVPTASNGSEDADRKAANLCRLVGNRAPRARLRADLTARASRMPGGMVITTGEDLPAGESVVARTLAIPFRRNDIDRVRLTRAQRKTDHMPHAMRGFIEWLRPQLGSLELWAEPRFRALREDFQTQGTHLRAPAAAAHLMLAGELFIGFLQNAEVIDSMLATRLLEQFRAGLVGALRLQQDAAAESNPGARFIDILRVLLETRRARLRKPGVALQDSPTGPITIGWQSETEIWLDPNLTYNVVAAFMRNQGDAMPLRARALWRRLRDDGFLLTSEADRFTSQRTVGSRKVRVLVLQRTQLETSADGREADAL